MRQLSVMLMCSILHIHGLITMKVVPTMVGYHANHATVECTVLFWVPPVRAHAHSAVPDTIINTKGEAHQVLAPRAAKEGTRMKDRE